MLPFSTHFFCDVSVLLGCRSPCRRRCRWLTPRARRNSAYFRWSCRSPGCWWHGQCWRRGVLVALRLTAPADPRAGPATGLSLLFLPWEGVIAFVTLGACLEGFHSKARPVNCPETSSPADIFLLHQFFNWSLLDFSRLPDYIQCRNANE